MVDIRETELPGVGTRFDFTTSNGERVGVLVHRSGRREIALYDRDDQDRCRSVLALSPDDASALAEVLGASRVVASLTAAHQQLAGLTIDWITVAQQSALAQKTLAKAAIHTRTGVSVVAIIRGDDAIAAPGADVELLVGDRVVAVGTAKGVGQIERELTGT